MVLRLFSPLLGPHRNAASVLKLKSAKELKSRSFTVLSERLLYAASSHLLLISIPVRTTYEHGNHVHTSDKCVSSYSKVDAVEQRYMVNSGAGGTKDRDLRIKVHW
jgi:hypothetical protein